MKITLICVGKIKEKFYREAVEEYKKRLSKYAVIDIKEVSDEKTPDNASQKEEDIIKNKEGERILKNIKEDSYVILTDIKGKKTDSISFSRLLEESFIKGKSHITFIIGGSLGVSESVKKRANTMISFSDMTFPHQLMRVILLEQIYRSERIINNEPYHK